MEGRAEEEVGGGGWGEESETQFTIFILYLCNFQLLCFGIKTGFAPKCSRVVKHPPISTLLFYEIFILMHTYVIVM